MFKVSEDFYWVANENNRVEDLYKPKDQNDVVKTIAFI